MTVAAEGQPVRVEEQRPIASIRDYWLLIRPRIIAMVLFTMTVSALVAGPRLPSWPPVAHALAGAGLVIAGAIALNQRIERRTDALMRRTATRPLPSGRMTARQAVAFGLLASVAGFVYLVLAASWTVLALTLASWIVYVWIYTPMKSLSAWQTPLGALAGSMPVLIGAAAAGEPSSAGALALFGISYFWQFPHAMAIAWLYREDFASAELKVATVTDPTGRSAALVSLAGAALLVPVSLAPWLAGGAGWPYGLAAAALGLGYLSASVAFLLRRDDRTARRLLRVSLAYLPATFLAILAAAFST